jgi:hypothetical protein
MPSTSVLKRAASFVESVGQTLVPMNHLQNTPFGETMWFTYKPTLKFILKLFSLYGKNRMLAHTLDGSMLSKREWHTCAGIKIIDIKAIDPRTGISMFGDPATAKYQGLNHLFVFRMVMAGETNALVYGAFKCFYNFCENTQDVTTSPYSVDGMPAITMSAECDMSMIWKGLCRGCAMKSKTYTCHCCDIRREYIHKPNKDLCARWCLPLHSLDPNWKCYHRDIVGTEALATIAAKLVTLQETLEQTLDFIDKNLEMQDEDYDDILLGSKANAVSIHFEPKDDDAKPKITKPKITCC